MLKADRSDDTSSGTSSAPPTADEISRRVADSNVQFVVLDDDPTGTQAVIDLPVITAWEEADFDWAMQAGAPAVYVMTNSRSRDEAELPDLIDRIVRNACAAARRAGRPVRFVSRSDSTLRGHYPAETDALAAALVAAGQPRPDGLVIALAFPDAGRVTIDGVHYTDVDGRRTPVAETDYAKDQTFGYSTSHLAGYVAEKTRGGVGADEVLQVSIADLERGAGHVATLLGEVRDGRVVVFDTADEGHLRVIALALDEAERAGRDFVYRVGPPFVRARIGQEPSRPLLDPARRPAAGPATGGGLVVIGSHVDLTNAQLAALRRSEPSARHIELDVDAILGPDAERAIDELVSEVAAGLGRGLVVLTTTRRVVVESAALSPLAISRAVSEAVVQIVRRVLGEVRPAFVVAKGGITSSDVASKALGIRHAFARGTVLPGLISIWEPVGGPASGIPYIVFPGNVGDEEALAQTVQRLQSTDQAPTQRSAVS